MKKFYSASLLVMGLAAATSTYAADDEWKFAIGTGMFMLNTDGDVGFNTNAFGPVKADATMSFDEISENMDSAAGLGGSATYGDMTILFKYGQMGLEDSITGTTAAGVPVTANLSFDTVVAELAAVPVIARSNGHVFGLLGGLRHTMHDWTLNLTSGGTSINRDTGDEWTDVLLGATHAMPINDAWVWSSRVDVGYSDVDTAYHINSGVNWQFADSWSARFYGDYLKYDYEDGNEGDAGWYLYDTAEYGAGATINFNF